MIQSFTQLASFLHTTFLHATFGQTTYRTALATAAVGVLAWVAHCGEVAAQDRALTPTRVTLDQSGPSSETGQEKSPSNRDSDTNQAVRLELVPIATGLKLSSFGDYPEKFRKTGVYQSASRAGLDLRKPSHPLVEFSYRNQKLFYLFYNLVKLEPDEFEFVIQRIRKTAIYYDAAGKSVRTDNYLVEAIKTKQQVTKKPDEHYGGYSLGRYQRRVVIKEFEVGRATIPGVAENKAWPFAANKLFKLLHSYQRDATLYNKVRFVKVKKWTVKTIFDRDGNYQFEVPEFGIRLQRQVGVAQAK